jgi:hypothetical protein
LARVRATFDFPAAGTPTPLPRKDPVANRQASAESLTAAPERFASPALDVNRPDVVQMRKRQVARGRVTPEERRTRVVDMIARGRLRAGTSLECRYFGRCHTAELLADGSVRHQGQVYTSLSAAGTAVKVGVHGPSVTESTTATDDMDFWHARDARDGDIVSLKVIRRRTADDQQVSRG